jgi:hypothetical protein
MNNVTNNMSAWVETWKGIAALCHRSERWCRYMARRPQDPLPVFKVGGIVRLTQVDLDGWLAREQQRSTVTRRDQPMAPVLYLHAAGI